MSRQLGANAPAAMRRRRRSASMACAASHATTSKTPLSTVINAMYGSLGMPPGCFNPRWGILLRSPEESVRSMDRRRFVQSAAAIAAAAAWPASAQQKYPSKPIKFVVPFAAGGGGDVVARMLAQRLQERLDNPV